MSLALYPTNSSTDMHKYEVRQRLVQIMSSSSMINLQKFKCMLWEGRKNCYKFCTKLNYQITTEVNK